MTSRGFITIGLGDQATKIEVFENDSCEDIQKKVDTWLDDNWPSYMGERNQFINISESEE